MSSVVILVAHGSRQSGPQQAFADLAGRLGQRLGQPVHHAFLQFGHPDVRTAIDAAIAAGAQRIVVFPHFLHTGTHVRQDLPELLDDARKRHPPCRFILMDCLESDPLLEDALTQRLRRFSQA